MFFLRWFCWLRGVHRFQLPPGDPDTTLVNVPELHCHTCGTPLVTVIAKLQDVSEDQALRYFVDPILNPPKVEELN